MISNGAPPRVVFAVFTASVADCGLGLLGSVKVGRGVVPTTEIETAEAWNVIHVDSA